MGLSAIETLILLWNILLVEVSKMRERERENEKRKLFCLSVSVCVCVCFKIFGNKTLSAKCFSACLKCLTFFSLSLSLSFFGTGSHYPLAFF